MVFSHIRTGHQDHRHANEAELRDAAGTSAAHHEIGSLISGTHVADEVGHLQVIGLSFLLQLFLNLSAIVFAGLPDELHVGSCHQVEMLQHTLVDGSCTEAATYQQDGFLCRVQAQRANGILATDSRLEQCLAHRIARLQNPVGGEEALHVVVGHTNLAGFLAQHLVGLARKRILLLNQTGDSHIGSSLQRGIAGIATYTHCHLRTELADDTFYHSIALPHLIRQRDVLQQIGTVETADGQALDLISGCRDTLHLHTPFGTYEKDGRIGILCPDGIGYRHSRKDVSACAATANDDPQFIVHCCIYIFGLQKYSFFFSISHFSSFFS